MAKTFGFAGKWDDWLTFLVILSLISVGIDQILAPMVEYINSRFELWQRILIWSGIIGGSIYVLYETKLKGPG
jgi:hypothetical protein